MLKNSGNAGLSKNEGKGEKDDGRTMGKAIRKLGRARRTRCPGEGLDRAREGRREEADSRVVAGDRARNSAVNSDTERSFGFG